MKSATPTGKLTLLFLGNLSISKGAFDFLDACVALKERRCASFEALVAGRFAQDPFYNLSSDDIRRRFDSYAQKLDGVLRYVGPYSIADTEKLLSQSDILVFPTRGPEGQPLVILEAMAAGLPVVTTKGIGVNDDTVVDGQTGFLVAPMDVGQIVGAIEKLMCDENLRVLMSRNAHAEYDRRFSPETHLRRFEWLVMDTVWGQL